MSRSRLSGKNDNSCLRNCVARLLGLARSKVPNFYWVAKQKKTRAFFVMQPWLAARGYGIIQISADRLCEFAVFGDAQTSAWIAGGPTRDHPHTPHAVLNNRYGTVYDGGGGLLIGTSHLYFIFKKTVFMESHDGGPPVFRPWLVPLFYDDYVARYDSLGNRVAASWKSGIRRYRKGIANGPSRKVRKHSIRNDRARIAGSEGPRNSQ